jgi:hypothetical protein
VTLERCVLSGNTATASGINHGSGGALAFAAYLGPATLVDCELCGNVAEGGVGGGGGRGGALHSAGTLDATRCRIDGNQATGPSDSGRGGALFVEVGAATLVDCEVAGNVADSTAAGIGGIGGAIEIWPGYGSATLRRCTVAGNAASAGGGSASSGGTGGGVHSPAGSNLTLDHTIVAANRAADPSGAPDVAGTATSSGHNLLGDSAGATLVGGSNDLQDVDPLFVDPVGGDWSLEASSPAADSGDAAFASTGSDLFGFSRVLDADLDRKPRVDRGAHEFCHVHLAWSGVATPGGTITLTTTGTAGLHGLMIGGVAPAALWLRPFGTLGIDLGQLSVIVAWPDVPSGVDVDLDPSLPAPFTFFVQQLGSLGRVGNLSNVVRVDIE